MAAPGERWMKETLKAFDPRQKFKEKREEMGERKEFIATDTNKETVCYKWCLIQRPGGGFKLGITRRKRKINNQKTPNVQ